MAALVVVGSQFVAFAPYASAEGGICWEALTDPYPERRGPAITEEFTDYRTGFSLLPLQIVCKVPGGPARGVLVVEAPRREQLAVFAIALLIAGLWWRGGALGEALGYAGTGTALSAFLFFGGGFQAGGFMSLYLVPALAFVLWSLRPGGMHVLTAMAIACLGWVAWVVWLFTGDPAIAPWWSLVMVSVTVGLLKWLAPDAVAYRERSSVKPWSQEPKVPPAANANCS